jgi:hypothetical protein
MAVAKKKAPAAATPPANTVKDRKKRSDSKEVQQEIMRDALLGKEPPKHIKISKKQRPFWDAVIAARADWTDVDLIHAGALACILCDIEEQRKLIGKEGAVTTSKAGNVVVNPRLKALEGLSRLALNYSVKIQVHANATIGSVDEQLNKNKQKQSAINAMREEVDTEEGLIARPKH